MLYPNFVYKFAECAFYPMIKVMKEENCAQKFSLLLVSLTVQLCRMNSIALYTRMLQEAVSKAVFSSCPFPGGAVERPNRSQHMKHDFGGHSRSRGRI